MQVYVESISQDCAINRFMGVKHFGKMCFTII
jgi:hypothetical protein